MLAKSVTCGDKGEYACNQKIGRNSYFEKKVDAIMHAGALHAPYASKYSEQQFVEVNVGGTANVLACGIPTVFTSTTSHTITNGQRMSCDHASTHTRAVCGRTCACKKHFEISRTCTLRTHT